MPGGIHSFALRVACTSQACYVLQSTGNGSTRAHTLKPVSESVLSRFNCRSARRDRAPAKPCPARALRDEQGADGGAMPSLVHA